MGEYATYKDEQVKIGTCEDMYYLRFDQRSLVTPERNSLDPADPETMKVIRFRFPWPDEDENEPGTFDDFARAIPVDGLTIPASVEHDAVQFTDCRKNGYLIQIPCPEAPGPKPHLITVHRNAWKGYAFLDQQGIRAGKLVCIFRCGGCGAKFNVPDFATLEPVIVAMRAKADKEGTEFYHKIADRITAGYAMRFPEQVAHE